MYFSPLVLYYVTAVSNSILQRFHSNRIILALLIRHSLISVQLFLLKEPGRKFSSYYKSEENQVTVNLSTFHYNDRNKIILC